VTSFTLVGVLMHNKLILLFLFIISIYNNAYAQICGPDFESIDTQCIQSYTDRLAAEVQREEKRKLVLAREKENPKSKKIKRAEHERNLVFSFGNKESLKKKKNLVFFYETGVGNLGKMIVRRITKSKQQCLMYVDSVTYNKKGSFEKSTTFEIKNVSNSWNVDRASFDEAMGSDFVLKKEFGLCVFKKMNGNIIPFKKLIKEEDDDKHAILMYAALFLVGLAVFLVTRTVFQDEGRFKAQEQLEVAEQEEKKNIPNDIVLKYSRPFFKRYFTPVVEGMKGKRKIREKYKRPLASSGMNKFLTPEDFYAFKLFLIIGFPIVYLGLRTFLEETWPLSYTPIISLLGFFYPDLWIRGKIDQRQKNVLENMPFVVDMLALSVEAGLDFVAAMQKVIEKAPQSALVEEFETLIKETKIGASRAEALRQLSWRVNSLPVSSFCATLIAADSVGANIGPILKTLAQELRQKRSSEIEKKGAQAATKILIPMIFFVLPAVLLVIAAPIALQLMAGG
jgi:tight adherence protein C